jgi:hypothetical protein
MGAIAPLRRNEFRNLVGGDRHHEVGIIIIIQQQPKAVAFVEEKWQLTVGYSNSSNLCRLGKAKR